ncbi:MAG: SRPBCC domain-containing protein [Spirochaetes bacterium]|nr:SRPBCC domain-containing protein [Spirochaetota bacterium]
MTCLEKEIIILAPVSRVWHELTQPSRMPLWMSQKDLEIKASWHTGEPFSVTSDFNGKKYTSRGTLLRFDSEREFAYSYWIAVSRLPDAPENYAVIRYQLTPTSEGTKLVLTHRNIRGEAAYPHVNFYWNGALYLLKQQAETPGAPAPRV